MKPLKLTVGMEVKVYQPINNVMAHEIHGKILDIKDGIVSLEYIRPDNGNREETKVRSVDVVGIL